MNLTWQDIADALRAEVAEGGQLLGLFEEQQRTLFRRQPETVLELGRAIQRQAQALDGCRRDRERAVAAFAAAQGRAQSSTLRSLLDRMPEDARPLLEALIGEVNRIIHRLRRAARLNHQLLTCMVECHQEVLRRVRPDTFTKTYSPTGRVSVAGLRTVPSIQTVG